MKKKPTKIVHKISIERIAHFRCGKCAKWWSIGDAPASKKVWYCPWCAAKAEISPVRT